MASSFLSLEKKGESVYKDRGSKFIGLAFPLSDEQEIKAHLESAKKAFPGARHYCYAWRLGPDGERYRANDDGEPAGSAGRPILGQLTSQEVTNALVVVVRYFGGTLLGVGGLIQAYKAAAAGAIANSGLVRMHIEKKYEVSFESDDTSAVMRLLKHFEARIAATDYHVRAHIRFTIKEIHSPELELKFAELYRVHLSPAE